MKQIKLGELTISNIEILGDGTALLTSAPEKDKEGDTFHVEIEFDGNFTYSKCYEHEVLQFVPSEVLKNKILPLAIAIYFYSISKDKETCRRFMNRLIGSDFTLNQTEKSDILQMIEDAVLY